MTKTLSKAAAGSLARKLLDADDGILGILVVDQKGNSLAYLNRSGNVGADSIDEQEIRRIGVVEFMALRMADRPGQKRGRWNMWRSFIAM
jgi:hypothetical protein